MNSGEPRQLRGRHRHSNPSWGVRSRRGSGAERRAVTAAEPWGASQTGRRGSDGAGGGQGPLGTKCPETNLPVLQGGYSQPTASPHTAEMEFYLHLDFPKGSLTP